MGIACINYTVVEDSIEHIVSEEFLYNQRKWVHYWEVDPVKMRSGTPDRFEMKLITFSIRIWRPVQYSKLNLIGWSFNGVHTYTPSVTKTPAF